MSVKKMFWVTAIFWGTLFCYPGIAMGQNEVEYDDITGDAQLDGEWEGPTANVSAIDLIYEANENLGYKDLLISKFNEYSNDIFDTMVFQMLMVHPNGDHPVFQKINNAFSPQAPEINTTGFLCADFDNNQTNDFFAPHPDGGRLYKNIDGSYFSDVTGNSPGLSVGSIGAAWGDVNGDSFLDLLVLGGSEPDIQQPGSTSNSQYLFINVPVSPGSPERKFEEAPLWPSTLKTGSVLMADFDNDSDIDIVLVQSGPSIPHHDHVRYYENSGDYSSQWPSFWFSDETASKFAQLGDHWDSYKCSAAVCDYNNNGNLDIVFINSNKYGYLLNDGNGVFSPGVIKTIGDNTADIGVLDFDLDGREDFIKGRSDETEFPLAYKNITTASNDFDFVNFTGSEHLDLGQWKKVRGLCLSDFTGNGLTELFYARPNHLTVLQPLLFQAEPKTGSEKNNWIGVKLTSSGGFDNYQCIGATVHVTVDSIPHHHAIVVDGGMGRASQKDLDLVFGLGDYSEEVELEATFPSGIHINIQDLEANQYHDLDLGNLVLYDTTVDFEISLNVLEGTEDWIFSWETSSITDDTKDHVHIDVLSGGGIVYRGGAVGPFDPLDYFGTTTMTKTENGQWLHQIEIPEVLCEQSRVIEYQVTSSIGPDSETSSIRSYQTPKFCVSAN